MNKVYKYLLVIAALAAAGFGIYEYTAPDKYQYWKELIAKDPKPDGVSEQEYREKLRAGYCWRDRKFYTPAELHRKAMVSFAGRLLGVAEAYRTDFTTTLAGDAYTSEDCIRNKKACRVWFVPQDYTNGKWDSLFLEKKDSRDHPLLPQYQEKEIEKTEDLEKYLTGYGSKGFTLVFRAPEEEEVIFGSDCCNILNKKEAILKIKNSELVTYIEFARIFPENEIPKNINIMDYGVVNFYVEIKDIIPGLRQDETKKEKTYQSRFSEILFMNNCGDILWQPYYIHQTKLKG